MIELLIGCILGAVVFCAIQLSCIGNLLDDLDERLYSIQLKCTRIERKLPRTVTDAEEEESTDE